MKAKPEHIIELISRAIKISTPEENEQANKLENDLAKFLNDRKGIANIHITMACAGILLQITERWLEYISTHDNPPAEIPPYLRG